MHTAFLWGLCSGKGRSCAVFAIENELEHCLTQRRLTVSFQGPWFTICPRDWPALWREGPAGVFGQPRLGLEEHTPPAPPPWSWEGAWLPAVIQALLTWGPSPLAEGAREGALFVRCKTWPGFLPRLPRPLQGPTFLVQRTSRLVSITHG